MVGSKCNLKIHVPLQIGAQNHLFRWYRNLRATLTAYIFGVKHDIHNWASTLQTTRGLLHRLKRHELWSTNGLKLVVSFYPPSLNSAFHFIAILRTRRSANGTQPNFVKRWTVGCSNNLQYKSWVHRSRKKWGQKTLHLFGFRRFQDLMANICRVKREIDNRARALKSTNGLRCPKISWTLVHKRLKSGPEVYPPSLFCFVRVHRTSSIRH